MFGIESSDVQTWMSLVAVLTARSPQRDPGRPWRQKVERGRRGEKGCCYQHQRDGCVWQSWILPV